MKITRQWFLFIFLLFISSQSFGQWVKGFYINNSDKKFEGRFTASDQEIDFIKFIF